MCRSFVFGPCLFCSTQCPFKFCNHLTDEELIASCSHVAICVLDFFLSTVGWHEVYDCDTIVDIGHFWDFRKRNSYV